MLAYKNGNLETIDALLRGGANPQSANEAQRLSQLLQPAVQGIVSEIIQFISEQ